MLWLVTVGAPSPHKLPWLTSTSAASFWLLPSNRSAQAELSVILTANVRLTLNVDTRHNYRTHPQHANQPSAAPGHAPFPAILDGELTPQLQWVESGGLPPACQHVPVCPSCLRLFVRESCGLPFPAVIDENEKQSSFNPQRGRKFPKSSFIQNICLI